MSVEGTRKEEHFWQKWYIKGQGVGAKPPGIKLRCVSPRVATLARRSSLYEKEKLILQRGVTFAIQMLQQRHHGSFNKVRTTERERN